MARYILFLYAVLICCPASAATRVPIVVDEPFADRRVAWPVTTGVPFPRGKLAGVEHCRLVDDRGVEQPLQTRVAATWDRRRTSVRWLTIDFVAQPGRKYALEFGPDVRRRRPPSAIKVERGGKLRVSTGAVSVDFSTSAKAALGAIRVDLDGDGRIDDDEEVAAGARDGEHYYLDQDKRRFSCAGDGKQREIVLETAGPVRACVRVGGFYSGPEGERIVKYRTRYHLFAGLPLIKVVDEFKIVGSTRTTRFRDIGFALDLPEGVDGRVVAVDASGEAGNQVERIPWRANTKSVSSYQATYRHFGNPQFEAAVVEEHSGGAKRLRQTDRMGEWMQVAGKRGSVTGSLRWFWQQFPKEWEATPRQLVLHLWSPRAGELDFGPQGLRRFFGEAGGKYVLDWRGVRGTLSPISNFFYFAGQGALTRGEVDGQGINKHHEFYLHFGGEGDASQQRGIEYGRLAAEQPLALAAGKWNCDAGVFGPLAARPNGSKYEAIVDKLFDLGRYAQDAFGDYGWWVFGSGPHYSYQWDEVAKRHYADPRRFEYHTYQKETQLWWNYFRSGERKFFDWALPSENHWVDVAVTHVPLKYRCDWRGGFRHVQSLDFRPGDWSIDSAMHYVRQRDSAEAWLRGGSQFWASYHRTLETTTLAYYLTGDERFNDVLEFWREYWSGLAGKTSASRDVKPWHRQQPWFIATGPDEPAKTWAEMIRDYAPFTSGLRHQMTQFFNLATLYEHTWDPVIGQALKECADAYLDPAHRIGVWRTQENEPPNHADAPKLAHYWVPALWKYARATGDKRMKKIFAGYFDACYAADPFRENVGQYSQLHLGYGYYFTRDPRHLRPIQAELDALLPNAAPLADPRELNARLYNPYAPIHCFAAVPRLIWALNAATADGAAVAKPPLRPQRTAIALDKRRGEALTATLWGFDGHLKIIAPNGAALEKFRVKSKRYSSDMQPFDRKLPGCEVFLHELVVPAAAVEGFYVLAPRLEMAVLDVSGGVPLINAARPVSLERGEFAVMKTPVKIAQGIKLESAAPKSLRVVGPDNRELRLTVKNNRLRVSADSLRAGEAIRVENAGRGKVWFRVHGLPKEQCWLSMAAAPSATPPGKQTLASLPQEVRFSADDPYVPGRFGQALLITPERELRFPDSVVVNGQTMRLFDAQQGTIEFWVRQLWDERISPPRRVTFLSNGLVQAWSPWKLPLGEWAHVAVEWRPLKRDPARQAVHIYVNGLDQQNYRSTWWEGYSQKPRTFPAKKVWLKEFVCKTLTGAPFAIDELRISNTPRYARRELELGGQRVFNPAHFTPPSKSFEADNHTTVLLRFDGNLQGSSGTARQPIQGRLNR